MTAPDWFEVLGEHDTIYLGAVGSPGVPDHETLWGLRLPIRKEFDQYVNLRPVRLINGVDSPLRYVSNGDNDMLCVREDSEGEYSGVDGRVHENTDHEVGTQVDVFTRKGVERISRSRMLLRNEGT